MAIEYLDPKSAKFGRTDGGFLSLKIGRRRPYSRVHLYRMFPLSDPDQFISVRDTKEQEIGVIRSLSEFPREAVRMCEEELNRRYFSPTIARLLALKEEFGYTYWDAETDAGVFRFTVKGGRGNVVQVAETSLLIIDVDGNRFIFPDFEATDSKFLKVIDAML